MQPIYIIRIVLGSLQSGFYIQKLLRILYNTFLVSIVVLELWLASITYINRNKIF
jgi:hypothetical protein